MKITCSDFGVSNDAKVIHLYHMENASGSFVEVTDYGARLVKLVIPDRDGNLTDVLLGCDNAAGYLGDTYSFGAVVGRVANRIKEGRFTLNGQTYQLAINNGPNHLHGGIVGFAYKIWETEITDDSLLLTLISCDGEEGYPGNLKLTVRYSWSDDNELSIVYEATADRDTPFNVTNHAYFNLNGEGRGNILSHGLFIDADYITELDDTQIPTGNMVDVSGTPFDFRELHAIGKYMDSDYPQYAKFGTYDHNFVINGIGFREAAILQSKATGIRLTCFTDQPGMQLYVADSTIPTDGKGGRHYAANTSVCLETQHFPDSINHPDFPDTVLRPGDTFRSKTLYHFSVF